MTATCDACTTATSKTHTRPEGMCSNTLTKYLPCEGEVATKSRQTSKIALELLDTLCELAER